MNIIYLTQWFDPEPGVIKGPAFVRQIEAAGHQVTVVTGFPNYPTGIIYPGYRQTLLRREIVDGVDVERIPLYPSHSRSSFGRAMNFFSFFASAFVYGLLRSGKADLIYVYHPPITVGLAAALFGWFRRKKFVIEIQDLWPDMLSASGMTGTGRLARVLGPVCNFVYARAAHVIVQSEGMRTRLIERGVPPGKLTTIRNPADLTALERPRPWARGDLDFSDRLAILYGGNLGAAQQLGSAIRATKQASDVGVGIDLLLMGRGIDAENLKALATELNSESVRFREPVAKEDVPAVFQAADVLLIQWASNPLFDITIPSKTQFCLASGKPILAALSGETAEILRESGAAIVVPPGDADAMADAMTRLSSMPRDELNAMGKRGEDYYRRTFSFEKMVADTVKVIEAAAGQA
jgi:colanic acid biosynthesis glycosyl transferase WcaI